MQFVVGQQRDAAIEILRQHLHAKSVPACSSAPMSSSAPGMPGDPAARCHRAAAAPAPAPTPSCRASASTSGRLRMWPKTLTVSLTSSGCTISVRPLGSVLTTGCRLDGLTSRRSSAALRPFRQLRWLGFAERNVLLAAEAAAWPPPGARTLRHHHGRHGMAEIEVFARDAVDVGHGHFLDACQILVGRVAGRTAPPRRTRPRPDPRSNSSGIPPARRSCSLAAATSSGGTPCCATFARIARTSASQRLGILALRRTTPRHRRARPAAADRARIRRRSPCPAAPGRRDRSAGCSARRTALPAPENPGCRSPGTRMREHLRAGGPVGVDLKRCAACTGPSMHQRRGGQRLWRDGAEQRSHLRPASRPDRHRRRRPGSHCWARTRHRGTACSIARAWLVEGRPRAERIVLIGRAGEHRRAQLLVQHVAGIGQVLRHFLLDGAALLVPVLAAVEHVRACASPRYAAPRRDPRPAR